MEHRLFEFILGLINCSISSSELEVKGGFSLGSQVWSWGPNSKLETPKLKSFFTSNSELLIEQFTWFAGVCVHLHPQLFEVYIKLHEHDDESRSRGSPCLQKNTGENRNVIIINT